ncbi:hypothetical protein OROGR_023715 [Orobanche gracilis]
MDHLALTSRCAHLAINDAPIVIDISDGSSSSDTVAVNRDTWSLVGRFLTDKPIKVEAMQQVMASVWRPTRCIDVFKIGENLFRFDFYHEKERARIMENIGPWSFENSTLACQYLEPGVPPETVRLEMVDMWVQVHGLPRDQATEEYLVRIGNSIDKFLSLDPLNFGSSWKNYKRLWVRFDVKEPLPPYSIIRRRDDTETRTSFKYERLHTFSFFCGKLGHNVLHCDDVLESDLQPSQYKYGVFMRPDQQRATSTIGQKWSDRKTVIPKKAAVQGDAGSRTVEPSTTPLQLDPKRKRTEPPQSENSIDTIMTEVPKNLQLAGTGIQSRLSQ